MIRLRGLLRHWRPLLLACTAVVVYAAVKLYQPSTLEFEPVRSPAGFRVMLLENPGSAPGSVAGVGQLFRHAARNRRDETALDLCQALLRDPLSPTAGNPDGAVTVVEFFDYQCPYCRVLSSILAEIQASDVRIRLIYKDWPIFGEASELAARAALAAAQQGKYGALHREFMRSRLVPSDGIIEYLAERVGLDPARYRRDMDSPAVSQAIRRNARLAKAFGFYGTPGLVVGRTIVQGALTREQLATLIDLEAESVSAHPCLS